ncbi:MAG: glycosyltransferase [Lachnospiraceae bacterium]|nr:glycosyltransferase [Lachnospiraceae bacterium]
MGNKEQNFISAVVYVHNAADRIEQFLQTIINVLEENFSHSEIICVNDFSNDESLEVIKKVSKFAKQTTVSVLNMSYFHGMETAMNAGVDIAIGDFVFEFDTTIQDFESEEILKVYRKSLEGYDIVSASPDKKQKLTSSLFYYVFDKFTVSSYQFSTESFRILSRRVINRISSMNKTVPYRKAIYANCGLKTANIRYTVKSAEKKYKSDKTENKYRKTLATDTLILFTEVGFRFSMVMTALMMLVAAFMAVYAVVIYLLSKPVAGWTTTILFLALAFFGLFGILTIVIKYLQILVNLVFKRKRYSFESIEKLTK